MHALLLPAPCTPARLLLLTCLLGRPARLPGRTPARLQIWKVKRLIKALDNARGNGTSMISLIMPPKSQARAQGGAGRPRGVGCAVAGGWGCGAGSAWPLAALLTLGLWLPLVSTQAPAAARRTSPSVPQVAQTQAMLANEYGTASNIKSRVNRQSVLAAITSAQQRLKLYTRVRRWGGGWGRLGAGGREWQGCRRSSSPAGQPCTWPGPEPSSWPIARPPAPTPSLVPARRCRPTGWWCTLAP